MLEDKRVRELQRLAKDVRKDILQMIYSAGSGHPGGSFSIVEILITLYYEVMKLNPGDPKWPKRDRFILSKGHACAGLYAILAGKGFFAQEELFKFRKIGGSLQGHPDSKKVPGIEVSTGSLGQGLSVGVGMAMVAKMRKEPHRVFVLLGDGECDEGQIWEAALSAAHRRLDNLTVIIDRNGLQLDGTTEAILKLEPLADKWSAFGWDIQEVEGHNFPELVKILAPQNLTGRPRAVIAHTVKGKGISYMEGKYEWHGGCPSKEQMKTALAELERA